MVTKPCPSFTYKPPFLKHPVNNRSAHLKWISPIFFLYSAVCCFAQKIRRYFFLAFDMKILFVFILMEFFFEIKL